MRFSACLLALALGCTSNSIVDPGHDAAVTPMDTGMGRDAFADDTGGSTSDTGGSGDDTGVADAGSTDAASLVDTNPSDAGPCMAAGACDPFDPTSCGTMACRPGPSGTACSTMAPGTLTQGMTCAHADDCAPGFVCLTFSAGEGAVCNRMCRAHSVGECGTGFACNGTLGSPPDPCLQLCRPIPPPCDIYAQDCGDPMDTCTLARNPETSAPYTACRPAGTQMEGQPCGGASGTCGHSLICVSTSGVASCRRVCDSTATPTTCPSPQVCTGLATTWGVHYCQAP